MAKPVKLDAIIDAIDFQSEERHSYFSKKRGEVVTVSNEEFDAVEENLPIEEFPDWQKEQIKIAQEILETDDYIALPDACEIDEYRMMEQFCLSLEDEKLRDTMYYSIKGRGAFRRFKDNIDRYAVADEWYKYREEAFKEIAIEWCQEHNIPFIDD
ncbi:MAG: UPF0158 family protein [bacterium]